MATTTLNYIVPSVRLRIGDTDSTSYRYEDEWILESIVLAVETLGRWMNFKYLINESDEVYRNPNFVFLFTQPPVIERYDVPLIAAMAAYIILEGSLENMAWSVASWRDAEISVSNLESAKTRSGNLARLWAEIEGFLTPPTKKLARGRKMSLPGYKGDPGEYKGEY